MKRTPLKRCKSTLAKKRLNPVSKKRKKQNSEYSLLRKDYLAKFPKCQVCNANPSDQIHHRKGRWGERLNDATYFLCVCGVCHHKIHSDPAWAYAEGFLIKR